jgi:sporulation protein YlmC with PRC-barrel domain
MGVASNTERQARGGHARWEGARRWNQLFPYGVVLLGIDKPRRKTMATRNMLLATALVPWLLAAPAFAQSPSTAPTTRSATTPTSSAGSAATTGSSHDSESIYLTADQHLRTSKLLGSSVYNDQKQKIGSIDELLLDQNHNITTAVLSVGGFLGIGSKLVTVPYSNLNITNDSIVLPGASKDQLTKMPSYKFDAT